jgi:hypothetical protein
MSHAPLMQYADSGEQSIIETFHELAEELRLPELDWDIVYYDGETLVEGRPRAEADVSACTRWARFLGMWSTAESPESSGTCWLGFNGPWTLEIVAEVR